MAFDSHERVSGAEFVAHHFPTNHYEVLGVDRNASEDGIQKAYRKLLIEGLHEDKIAAMADGSDKSIAQAKLEAAKEALKVLSNRRMRAEYDAHLAQPDFGQAPAQEQAKRSVDYEKRQEWFEMAKAKLDLATDKEQMMAAIEEFNSHFEGRIDMNARAFFDMVTVVSVPEGDFLVTRVADVENGGHVEELVARELTPFKLGDRVRVKRSSGQLDEGWEVAEFIIKDKSHGPERYYLVTKVIDGEQYEKQVPAKQLRLANL